MNKHRIIIKSIDHLVNDTITQPKNPLSTNPLLWKDNKRILICGASGCGKTTMIFNILDLLNYDHLIVISKTLDHRKYQWMIEEVEKQYNKDIDIMFKDGKEKISKEQIKKHYKPNAEFYNNVKDMPSVESIDTSKRTIVLFDDIMLTPKQSDIIDYFIFGRNKNCTLLFAAQKFYKVNNLIRENCNVYIFYKMSNRNISTINNDLPLNLDKGILKKIIDENIKNNYDCVIFDVDNDDNDYKIRNMLFQPIGKKYLETGQGIDIVKSASKLFKGQEWHVRDINFDKKGIHLTKHNYTGPFSDNEKKVNYDEIINLPKFEDVTYDKIKLTDKKYTPINAIDKLSMLHDMQYSYIENNYKDPKKALDYVHKADKIMLDNAKKIFWKKGSTKNERWQSALVVSTFYPKIKLGLGLKKNEINPIIEFYEDNIDYVPNEKLNFPIEEFLNYQ